MFVCLTVLIGGIITVGKVVVVAEAINKYPQHPAHKNNQLSRLETIKIQPESTKLATVF